MNDKIIDGVSYHCDEDGEPIIDDCGYMIPSRVCICAAWNVRECCCGAWYEKEDEWDKD